MPKFMFTELVDTAEVETARLGAGSGAANNLSDADVGKFVHLVGESRYDLCAVGNEIEGRINSIETATQDAYTIGGVMTDGRFAVTFDGVQATPGTGNVAIGDYVVCGTPVAKGTPLAFGTPARVCKATAAPNTLQFKYRVVSLGAAGTGAPGTQGLIEYIC
jgi:hypothetical protein